MEQYNLPDIVRGDTFPGIEFTLTSEGDPVDLTDHDIKMQVRLNGNGPARLKWSIADDNMRITDAVNGVFEIDAMDMEIPAGEYKYDIQFEYDGAKTTYIGGSWLVLPDVTK